MVLVFALKAIVKGALVSYDIVVPPTSPVRIIPTPANDL